MALGSVMACFYLWNLPFRGALWGPNGLLPYKDYVHSVSSDALQLYRYSASPAYAEFFYWMSLVVAVAFAIGLLPRITCWLFVITAYATISRNWQATDAGLNLVVLLAFLLCFCDTGGVRAFRFERRFPSLSMLSNLSHNCARFLIAWQICMVYFWAVFYKLGGENWRDGTALYYVLHLSHFTPFHTISVALYSNAVFVAAMTYMTIGFQMAFPFLMWNTRLKPYLIGAAVIMHLAIGAALGLVLFSATMIAADVALLSDNEMLRLRLLLFRGLALCARWVVAKRGAMAQAPLSVFAFAIFLLGSGGVAKAAAEFCPATVSPVYQRVSAREYAFTLGGMSRRDVSGTVRIETASGWFEAPFERVPLRSVASQYNDDGTAFTLDDYLSPTLIVRFPDAVSVTYAYIARASTAGDTVFGWDAKGSVWCDPTGKPATEKAVGTETPNAPRMDLTRAIPLRAESVHPPLTSECGDPFSLVGVKRIAYVRYPALLRESGYTDLPKGSSIIVLAINDSGTVIDAWTWETSGNEALDAAAIESARNTVYSPARAFCENVPGYYFMKVAWGA